MAKVHWLLFLHLVGAFLFVSGAVAAGIAQISAMRRERPSEVALLLRAARVGAVLSSIGALVVLGFGIWLATDRYDLGDGWISASMGSGLRA